MLKRRIIPCLDVHNGRVVKGVHFKGLRDAGDPIEAARAYDKQGADEICLLDITATTEGRETFVDVVRRVAPQLFVPMTVGGGIRRASDVRRLLNAGADKVALNSAAVTNPNLIRSLADSYGSQCIVIAVDVRRIDPRPHDRQPMFEVVINGGRRGTGDGRTRRADQGGAQWCPTVKARIAKTVTATTRAARARRGARGAQQAPCAGDRGRQEIPHGAEPLRPGRRVCARGHER